MVGAPVPRASELSAANNAGPNPLPVSRVEELLHSSPAGLSQADAVDRLNRFGPNEIQERKSSVLIQFLGYLWGPIPWMIEAAMVLSALAHHWPDFLVIALLLVTNTVVGFWEEHQASNAVAALKAKLAIRAQVKRDSHWINVAARELVPGDVIQVHLGDIVPADARLIGRDPVEIDQSALTGELLPTVKSPGDSLYSGSIVRRGESVALIYGTGSNTFFGKTAELVQSAHTVSHFQRAVLKIGNYLILFAAALVSLIIAVALFRGDQLLTTLQFALVLTVASIPVAMPTVLSVTMAVGARLLARKSVVVTQLASIEELAGVDVLCSDKTGTLTQNKLALGDPFILGPLTSDDLIFYAALASRTDGNDAIDLAILGALKTRDRTNSYQVAHFTSFDPVHKRTEAAIVAPDGTHFNVAKGAVQVMLAISANRADVEPAVTRAVDSFASRGFRSLGVAHSYSDGKWQFIGVLPLFDPPRTDAKDTITAAEDMGVRIKMVTGDQLAIAREAAEKLGLGTNILDANELTDPPDRNCGTLAKLINSADGFAQVFPQHKFQIVETLQRLGHIVGMTGDGVNDAPALKEADCGVAVSSATDAARAASSIVLITPGLAVIVDAIRESRKIFQRMNSYAIYRIAETLRVLLFMTLSILVFNFYPVTAVMIVLLALLNDGAIISIAYDNVLFNNRPESWNMQTVLTLATVLGCVGVVATFGLFYLGESAFHMDRLHIQTLMYLKLSVAGHLTIFVTRTRGPFWSSKPAPILLIAVLGTQTVATLFAVYGVFMTPIGWGWALFVWGYAIAWAAVNDGVKLATYGFLGVIQRNHQNTTAPVAKPPVMA